MIEFFVFLVSAMVFVVVISTVFYWLLELEIWRDISPDRGNETALLFSTAISLVASALSAFGVFKLLTYLLM